MFPSQPLFKAEEKNWAKAENLSQFKGNYTFLTYAFRQKKKRERRKMKRKKGSL
jgi:hypothetical protein